MEKQTIYKYKKAISYWWYNTLYNTSKERFACVVDLSKYVIHDSHDPSPGLSTRQPNTL